MQVPKLCGLVKRGIGLNTRTGCARFIVALTTRQGADIKPHTAAFLKVPCNPIALQLALITRCFGFVARLLLVFDGLSEQPAD